MKKETIKFIIGLFFSGLAGGIGTYYGGMFGLLAVVLGQIGISISKSK